MGKQYKKNNMKHLKELTLVAAAITTMEACNDKLVFEEGYIGRDETTAGNCEMTEHTLLQFGRISDPQLSPDGKTVIYGVSYISERENRSCRNLFSCNADGSGKRQLTACAQSIYNARFSPDGNSIYFIQGDQIWKADFKDGNICGKVQVSDVSRGVSGFKISPDGKNILYISTVPGRVKGPSDIDPALDKAQAYITDDLMYRHWDHWTTETPRTFVAELSGEKITDNNSHDILGDGNEGIELPSEPFGGEEQFSWSPDSRHIAYSCRKLTGREYAFSTNTDIFIYDLVTNLTLRVTDGGGYDTDPAWSPDGEHLAWISMARDGYEADMQRILVADIKKDPRADEVNGLCLSVAGIREVSGGLDADASGLFWSKDSKRIYFNAVVQARGGIFCAFAQKGDTNCVRRITPESWMNNFGQVYSEEDGMNGTLELLASYESMMFPTELCRVLIGEKDSSVVNITCENDHILNTLPNITQEEVWLPTADESKLHCWVLYPPMFDSSKVYPAIEILNGGPQTSLDQSWSYRWNFRLMASKGYIVVLPNRHGDSGFGQQWKEQISGDYCGLNMKDYLIAARYIKSKPYTGKLAAAGASYGGYSAYMMEGLGGEIFDCIIAHAGIFSEKDLWFTTEEMWFPNWDNGGLMKYYKTGDKIGPDKDGITFGGIQQAGAPYSKNAKTVKHYSLSPDTMVTKWRTPILCMHGMMDFRIPYTQGMAAFNAARMMGVPARLVVFPEENHWILQPQNSLLWHKEFYSWLEKWTRE